MERHRYFISYFYKKGDVCGYGSASLDFEYMVSPNFIDEFMEISQNYLKDENGHYTNIAILNYKYVGEVK